MRLWRTSSIVEIIRLVSPLVRTMTPAEVATLVDWAAAEGWNPGRSDAVAFHAADPQGFLGAFVEGELAAGIAATSYGDSYGFIGLYICRQDLRGLGYGKRVWNAGMNRLVGRTVGLDGVAAQFDNYRRKGFEPAYRTIRYGGILEPEVITPSISIELVSRELLPQIIALDRVAFGAPRTEFLRRWLAEPHVARVAVENGRVTGIGALRKCLEGWKVGPLFALEDMTARALVVGLARLADGPVYLDVPAPRREFTTFLEQLGMSPGFETARMYLGTRLPLNDMVWGVTTLELG